MCGEAAVPVDTFTGSIAIGIPRVAGPGLEPDPVALPLFQGHRRDVGGDRPVPVEERVEVKAVGAQPVAHGEDGFLDEFGGAVAERFEVGQNVDIGDVSGSHPAHREMESLAHAAGLPGGERFAVEFRLGVEVPVDLQCLRHDLGGISCVGAQDDRRLDDEAGGFHAIPHAPEDDIGHPAGLRLLFLQGLAQTGHETDVGEFAHECGDGFPGVIRGEIVPGVELGGEAVAFGERLGDEDAVELLHQPDATAVTLGGEPAKHPDVAGEDFVIHLNCLRVVRQAHERGERVAVPQVERVHPEVGKVVEVSGPARLVVEEREFLRRVGVFVNPSAGEIGGLLHANARAPQDKGGGVGDDLRTLRPAGGQEPGEFQAAVERAGIIRPGDRDAATGGRRDGEALLSGHGCILAHDDGRRSGGQGRLQAFGAIADAWRGTVRQFDGGACRPRGGKEDGQRQKISEPRTHLHRIHGGADLSRAVGEVRLDVAHGIRRDGRGDAVEGGAGGRGRASRGCLHRRDRHVVDQEDRGGNLVIGAGKVAAAVATLPIQARPERETLHRGDGIGEIGRARQR